MHTDDFYDRLTYCAENPDSPEAKKLMNELLPVIHITGASVPYGPVERNQCISKLYAMAYFHGLPSYYLTIAIADIDSPLIIRLSKSATRRDGKSAGESDRFADCLDCEADDIIIPVYTKRARILAENPVAAAIVFRMQVDMVFNILIGLRGSHLLKSSGLTKTQARAAAHRSKSDFDETPGGIGLFGTPKGVFAVFEVQGRGSLHTHMAIWGGLPPRVIHALAHDQTFAKEIADSLDSRVDEQLKTLYHNAADLQNKQRWGRLPKNTSPEVYPSKIYDSAAFPVWLPVPGGTGLKCFMSDGSALVGSGKCIDVSAGPPPPPCSIEKSVPSVVSMCLEDDPIVSPVLVPSLAGVDVSGATLIGDSAPDTVVHGRAGGSIGGDEESGVSPVLVSTSNANVADSSQVFPIFSNKDKDDWYAELEIEAVRKLQRSNRGGYRGSFTPFPHPSQYKEAEKDMFWSDFNSHAYCVAATTNVHSAHSDTCHHSNVGCYMCRFAIPHTMCNVTCPLQVNMFTKGGDAPVMSLDQVIEKIIQMVRVRGGVLLMKYLTEHVKSGDCKDPLGTVLRVGAERGLLICDDHAVRLGPSVSEPHEVIEHWTDRHPPQCLQPASDVKFSFKLAPDAEGKTLIDFVKEIGLPEDPDGKLPGDSSFSIWPPTDGKGNHCFDSAPLPPPEKRTITFSMQRPACPKDPLDIRNRTVVPFNKIMTGVLACNTAFIIITTECDAKNIMWYLPKYMCKNSAELANVISLMHEAVNTHKKYGSRAENAETRERQTQYVANRLLNNLSGKSEEISASMAALALLGVPSFMCTSTFFYIFPKPALEYLLEKTRRPEVNDVSSPRASMSAYSDEPDLPDVVFDGVDQPVDDANYNFLERCDAEADRIRKADRMSREEVHIIACFDRNLCL